MEKAQLDAHYSWLRTRLSVENTLMGWIRTTTSLIGFGFTIYQFLPSFKAMLLARSCALTRRAILASA